MGSFVALTAADGTAVPAWVARPDGPVRGAVVVAQEIFGVNVLTQRFLHRSGC